MGWQQSTRWQQTRLRVMERDEWRCRVRLPGCKGQATDADHIVPVADGGDRWDLGNLRAACGFCNRSRASRQKHREGWRRSKTEIVLVVGPVGAGKSTFVEKNAGRRDVVVDYDSISQAFGQELPRGSSARHDVATLARGAVLTAVRRGEVDAPRVWIVSSNPKAESLFPHHRVEVVDPGRDEVLRRAAEAGRPASFVRLIDGWYAQRSVHATAGPSRDWYGDVDV